MQRGVNSWSNLGDVIYYWPIDCANLFQVGAPLAGSSDSFLLDMSTSAVAVGKIEIQMRKKEPLPSLGWALGNDGKPTTDANEAFYNGSGKNIFKCSTTRCHRHQALYCK